MICKTNGIDQEPALARWFGKERLMSTVSDSARQVGTSSDAGLAGGSLLDEIVRDGARQMLAAALQVEVAAYIEQHAHERDERGHRLVVRNGHHGERQVTTAAGAVAVRQPRVNDRRGMADPVLAVRDGALGFWRAIRDVFPATKEQRCWFHKSANVLAALPKSAQPGATRAMQEIYQAQDKDHAREAARAFAEAYGAKWLKAVAKITEDLDVLLAFYDYPAEHWVHLRTTNPIESTFSTVRLRQRVTKGPGSRAAGIAKASKLIQSAQTKWRAVNAPHLVNLVRAGARFKKGKLVERPDDQPDLESGGDQQAA